MDSDAQFILAFLGGIALIIFACKVNINVPKNKKP